MIKRTFALLKKDILLELRRQHTFYGILLYIASTVFVIYLSLPDSPDGNVWNSLFWVIQLFVCVNTVAKSFLQESKGLMLYYYSIASPIEFITAKLLFNIILMSLMSSVSLLLFYFFSGCVHTHLHRHESLLAIREFAFPISYQSSVLRD